MFTFKNRDLTSFCIRSKFLEQKLSDGVEIMPGFKCGWFFIGSSELPLLLGVEKVSCMLPYWQLEKRWFKVGLQEIRNVLGIYKIEQQHMNIPPTKHDIPPTKYYVLLLFNKIKNTVHVQYMNSLSSQDPPQRERITP